jgi:hypothetical protein
VLAQLLETIAVVSVPAALLLVLVARIANRPRRLGAAAAVVLGATLVTKLVPARTTAAMARSDRPAVAPERGYFGSASCRPCHPGPFASWHDSYHRTMTQLPSATTVVGDWSGVEIDFLGRRHRFEREGDAFFYVEPDGARHPIVLLTGSHRMQVAWYSAGKRRTLAQVPFTWLIEEKRWAPRNAAFLRPPEVASHPPSEERRWNDTCLRCHSTDPRPLLGPSGESDTRVAELGIACEACHGPGGAHVQANQDPARRYALHTSGRGDPTIVNPARLPAERANEVCGQCHSVSAERTREEFARFAANGSDYRPGQELSRSREVLRYCESPRDELTRTIFALAPTFMVDRFWRDGMLRVTGREMSALAETPCSTSGKLTCLSCHSPHQTDDDARPRRAWADGQLRPAALGDGVCLECHAKVARAGAGHTHHAPSSPGSSCLDCHMPHTSYGLQKAIRTHRVGRPSAAESHDLGRPNACNLCHLDKTLAWTADRLAEWYGQRRPELSPDESTVAAGHLWLLSGDAGERALAAWSTGWQPANETASTGPFLADLARLLDDPYESVRLIAWRSLRKRPGLESVDYDFLGSRDARLAARARVLERVPASVGLDAATAERLASRRDDRRVDLNE